MILNESFQPRLVVLQTHVIQYYAPLFQAISALGQVDLRVVYLTDEGVRGFHDPGFGQTVSWDIPLLDGYDSTVLEPDRNLIGSGLNRRDSRRLVTRLEQLKPDFIWIFGYASRMNWRALHWARKNSIPVAYFSDSNANNVKRGLRRRMTEVLIRRFFGSISVFFSPGEANRSYLEALSARPASIVNLPFAIDVNRFSDGAPVPEHARSYDFAWTGKLSPRKRPLDFVAALRQLGERSGDAIKAVLVGDGELRREVETAAASLPSSITLERTGFVNQLEMADVLRRSETFVFTSECEPYGLAASEACAAGCALVVAKGMGCIGAFGPVREELNALLYDPGDLKTLSEHMERVQADTDLRVALKRGSCSVAPQLDISVAAKVISETVLRHLENAPTGLREAK